VANKSRNTSLVPHLYYWPRSKDQGNLQSQSESGDVWWHLDVRTGPGFSKATPPKGLSHDGMKAWLGDQVRRAAQGWQPKAPKLNVIWRDLKPSKTRANVVILNK